MQRDVYDMTMNDITKDDDNSHDNNNNNKKSVFLLVQYDNLIIQEWR